MTHDRHHPGNSRRYAIYILFLSIAACSLAACSKEPKKEMPRGADLVPVSVAIVLSKDVPVQLTAIGNVEASSTVGVKALVGGELTRVNFTEGQDVQKGMVLFTIDSRPFEAELKRAEANLARDSAQLKQAEANLARDTAQAQNADVAKRRYQALVEKGIVAKEQYDQVNTNAEALDASLKADRAAIENARESTRADNAALESAKIQLGYCTIRAPIGGRTGSLMVHEGNIVKANDVALVVINQVQPINVSFSVPEQSLPEIKKYMAAGKLKVGATVPNDAGPREEGVLSFVDNAIDTQTGTIRLKGTFQNPLRRLWPGQFANVDVTLSRQLNAVVVPSEAVQTGQAGTYVFVVKPDMTAESRPVTPGRNFGSETVIERGLQPGERVVTDGQLRLFPGARVQVKEPVGKQEIG